MTILSQNQVNSLTASQRQIELNKFEDLMCNTDYTTSEGLLAYNVYQKNAQQIINKQNGEY